MVSMRLLLTSLILLAAPLAALPASADPVPDVTFGPCPEGEGSTVDVDGRRVQDCSPPLVGHCDGLVAVAGHCAQTVLDRPGADADADTRPFPVELCGAVAVRVVDPVETDCIPVVQVLQCSFYGNSLLILGKYETPCIRSPCDPTCDAASDDERPVSVNQCAGRGNSVTVLGKTTPCVYGVCDPSCDRPLAAPNQPVEVGSCWYGHGPGIHVMVLGKFGGCYPVPEPQETDSHQDPEPVEQCGDRVAFQVTVHHAYQSDCIGLNVYVFECPGGHRVMIGDHPTGCLPTRPST